MKYKQIKELYPELLEEQTCQHCGKKFYYTHGQIRVRVRQKLSGHVIIVGCCKQCSMSILNKSQEHKDKSKQTYLKKYGVEHYSKTQEYKDKIKQTCLERYGVENYLQTQDCKDRLENARIEKHKLKPQIQINFQGLSEYLKTHSRATLQSLEIYFSASDVQDIMKRYNLSKEELRYRIHKDIPLDKIFFCKNCGKKIIFHKHNGYGDFCSIKCSNTFKNKSQGYKNKIKQTYLKKYGVTTNLQLKSNREKSKQTCLKKYGAKSYVESQVYQDRVSEIQEKIHKTKIKNNSYHLSKDEKLILQMLLTKFNDDVIYQFKSDKYPFHCDFYIKSLDFYLEYNGHWTHGKELYNPNNSKHQKIVAFWKKKVEETNFKGKNKNQYAAAIYVWTKLDPLKVETAKKNKLNYKIFWNIEEVKDWINSLK